MRVSFLFMLSLLTGFNKPMYAAKDDTQMLLLGAAGIGCTIAGIYLLSCLFSESDEQVLEQAQKNKNMHQATYGNMITICKEYPNALNAVNEDALYAFAVAKHHDTSITSYKAQLNTAITELEALYKKLSARIANQSNVTLQHSMSLTARELHTLIENMTALYTVLNKYKSYFNLYETEATLGAKYTKECALLTQTYGNRDNQTTAIRYFVLTESFASSNPFPRVTYLKALENGIKQLEKALTQVDHYYPRRIQPAQQLLDTLKAIKAYIITDALYSQEAILYEKDQREKERLRIEQEKADAEKRKAAAAERQAQAERERAQAERDRAWAEHRKADAALKHARAQQDYVNIIR